jgi:hypothetical protein
MTDNFQVTMHIVDKPLKFQTAEDFAAYYESQRQQGGNDETGLPIWKKFSHLPMLKLVDRRSASEEFEIEFRDKLPEETVSNEKGVPLLVIG